MQNHNEKSCRARTRAAAKELVRGVITRVAIEVLKNLPWTGWLQDLVSLWTDG
jgi:hypothetical protein